MADEPFHVLLANDDGITAPGLVAIAEAIAADPTYRLTIVAPATQQSTTGHSLVVRREVEVRRARVIAGSPSWSVDGTPATVVRVGLTALLKDDPPDSWFAESTAVRIGIGSWVSGTVAAAHEGVIGGRLLDRTVVADRVERSTARLASGGPLVQTGDRRGTGERSANRRVSQRQCAERHRRDSRLSGCEDGPRRIGGRDLRAVESRF